ncbi:MAG: response regulator [Anaerolineales bacterium]|nr:response regulator [Anaerolineales bacterium]
MKTDLHSNARVLVVDDEAGVMRLCERFLTRAGYQVTPLSEARQAAALLDREAFDLLLVDIRMPEVDGFEMLAQARRAQPHIAVVIMTGYGTVETAVESLRQGADGMILKPFSGAELVQSVERALRERQREREILQLQTLRPLLETSEALFSQQALGRLQVLVVEFVGRHLDCGRVSLLRQEAAEQHIELLASLGEPLVLAPELLPPESQSQPEPLLIAGQQLAPAWQACLENQALAALLLVSLPAGPDRMLVVAARQPGQPVFRDTDIEMLAILARQAGIAFENARLYADLQANLRQVEASQQALIQSEKMAAVGRLTASLAHEINNPLQAMQNCLHLAGRHDLALEKREGYLALASEELERLMHTVRRMLDFYRPGARDRKTVVVNDLVTKVLQLLETQLRQAGVQVNLNLEPALPPVLAVGNQIQQVILNLILNAIEAMPQGGQIEIITACRQDLLQLSIIDSGPGIPAGEQQQIFEPFASGKEKGLGLGLSVSYGILTAHGGALEVLPPEDGQGAHFRLSLPLQGTAC